MGATGSKPEAIPPITYDKDGKQLGRYVAHPFALNTVLHPPWETIDFPEPGYGIPPLWVCVGGECVCGALRYHRDKPFAPPHCLELAHRRNASDCTPNSVPNLPGMLRRCKDSRQDFGTGSGRKLGDGWCTLTLQGWMGPCTGVSVAIRWCR